MNEALNATLVGRFDLSAALCVIYIRPDAGVGQFEPGQFVRLGLHDPTAARPGTLVKRAYSVVSSPEERERLEIHVVRVSDGQLTPQVWRLEDGARLWVEGRYHGELTLSGVSPQSDLVMVATGTGIAPYVSMLRRYAGQWRWRRFIVIHGVRTASDLGYRAELESLVRRWPDVTYVPVLSREPDDSGWTGLRGRVQQVLDAVRYASLFGQALVPERAHVFLCGHPDMVQSARVLLEDRGFRLATRHHSGELHVERYW